MSARSDLNSLAASVGRLSEAVDRLQETVRRHGYRLQALETESTRPPATLEETVTSLENAIDWLLHAMKDTQESLEACEQRMEELSRGRPAAAGSADPTAASDR